MFAIGTDGTAYHNELSGSCVPNCQTSSWEPIGRHAAGMAGGFRGSIAAVSTDADGIELIAMGSDGNAYRKSYTGGMWDPPQAAPWQSIGGKGVGTLRPSPAVSSWGLNRFDVFANGDDGKVYHKFFDGAWNPPWPGSQKGDPGSQKGDWEPVGGLPTRTRIAGSPSVVSWGQDRLDIFAAGVDGRVYHKFFGALAWGPGSIGADWESIGGLTGASRN